MFEIREVTVRLGAPGGWHGPGSYGAAPPCGGCGGRPLRLGLLVGPRLERRPEETG